MAAEFSAEIPELSALEVALADVQNIITLLRELGMRFITANTDLEASKFVMQDLLTNFPWVHSPQHCIIIRLYYSPCALGNYWFKSEYKPFHEIRNMSPVLAKLVEKLDTDAYEHVLCVVMNSDDTVREAFQGSVCLNNDKTGVTFDESRL